MFATMAVLLTSVVDFDDLTGAIAAPMLPPVVTTDEFINNLPQDGSFWGNFRLGNAFDVHPVLRVPVRDENITKASKTITTTKATKSKSSKTKASKAVTMTTSKNDDNVWDVDESSFDDGNEVDSYDNDSFGVSNTSLEQRQLAVVAACPWLSPSDTTDVLRAFNGNVERAIEAVNGDLEFVHLRDPAPIDASSSSLRYSTTTSTNADASVHPSRTVNGHATIDEFISNLPQNGSFWQNYVHGGAFDVHQELPATTTRIEVKGIEDNGIEDNYNDDNVLVNDDDSSSRSVTTNGEGKVFLWENEGTDPSSFATILPTSESSGNHESRELLAVSSLSEVGRVSDRKAKSMLKYANLEDATRGLLSRGVALNRLEKVYVEIRNHLNLRPAKMVRHDVNHRAKHDPEHTVATACEFHYPAPEDKVVVDPVSGFGTCATLRFSEANFRHARTREARHWLDIEDGAELNEVVRNEIDQDARHANMFSISNDLWPYPEELGFDFLKDVWNKITRRLQERLAAAQSMYLASFNFEEIVAGRTEIRHYAGGRNPRDFWPRWIIASEQITNTVLAFFHPNRQPFGVSFGVGPHLIAATYGGLGIEEAERADMALSYVFEEQLHGGTLTLNRALSDGLTSAQHAARLTDWLAASEDWPGPWLFNGDTFTADEKTAYEEIVSTARSKLGHKGHTEAVRRIAAALDIDLDQAASVLGRRGHAGAVRSIAAALGINLDQAKSELSRRGGNSSTRADERGISGLFFSVVKKRDSVPCKERGERTTGIPRRGGKESKIIVLYLEDMIYYSHTDPPMLEKLVELKVFSSEKAARNNIPRLKEYGQEVGKFQLKPGPKCGKRSEDFVQYKGACGSGMPSDLKVWMSVGEIPEGAKELKKQSKRKREDDKEN